MDTSAVVQAEENGRQDGAAEISSRDPIPKADFLDHWLLPHLNALALAVVAAGFALRILVASRTYLNPDEALHYILLNQSSLYLAYKASLTNAHPPLIYLVLYFWHFLGRSELMLRFPSALAGTGFCWFFYKWMVRAFGHAAGWIGLILAAFSPAMIALSAELRAYALLLFCIGGALYFLELAFAEKSVRPMWWFSAFLYLAILSHYSAVFFAAAAGVYALARIADSHLPRKVIIAWAAGQAGGLAICGFLYVTHLSKLKDSIAVWSLGFDSAYFHRDSVGIFAFTKKSTFDIFLFLFGQPNVAQAMLLCFLAGVAFLFMQGLLSRQETLKSNRLGLLLSVPFFAVWCAAIAGIYPYIGSRHTAFLAPFAIAAASYLMAGASGQKIWAGILIAAFLMVASNSSHASGPTEEMAGNGTPALMASAISYVEQSAPQGDHILVDYQSSLPLAYYLCGPRSIFPIEMFHQNYFDFTCKGYSVVSLHVWKLIPQNLRSQFHQMALSRGLEPGDRVWIYQTGWGDDFGSELAARDASFRCLAPRKFGEGVTVTLFVVGPDFSPQPPLGDCARIQN